jgi:selenium-binding protein 1
MIGRREFLAGTAAAVGSSWLAAGAAENASGADDKAACCGATYASPAEAMQAERETLAYVTAIHTQADKPDYLATVDVDPASRTYCQVVHRAAMPKAGDELHHFGWNACSSCHGDPDKSRRYLIVPGLKSGRIHVLDAANPRSPTMYKVIEPEAVARSVNLSAPHTVHCLPDGRIMLSMLGDAQGNGPGGFLLLDQQFEIAGRWESDQPAANGSRRFNYDFWYQPRHNVMVSSEWAAPKTFQSGFDLADVKAGKYGQQLHFWGWKKRQVVHSADLGEAGLIPLEVRFHHNPDSTHGFVGAALASAIWHWHQAGGKWQVEKVIQVDPVEAEGWPFPVPGLITDLVLSLDDRWLYFSDWLHGDVRQYDVSDPSRPRLTGRVWCGGVLGKPPVHKEKTLTGGPQMLQLSLDGKRLYVTSSLYSTWDNQFYPRMAEAGSYMMQFDCTTSGGGGLSANEKFFVDFGSEPGGPARAHEVRFPGGDSTSDIWV